MFGRMLKWEIPLKEDDKEFCLNRYLSAQVKSTFHLFSENEDTRNESLN